MYNAFIKDLDNISISILSDPQRTRQESLEYISGILYAVTELSASDSRVEPSDYDALQQSMDELWKRCWKRVQAYKPN